MNICIHVLLASRGPPMKSPRVRPHHFNANPNLAREFGIVIGDKDLWGHGYGSEAIRLAIGYGFKRLKLHRIQLIVLDFNKRAHHAYRKVGFVEEGVQRDALLVGGRWHDVIMMGMLKRERKHGR